MSLRTYKKQELKEMCQKLSLNEEGLKNELEDRLQNYLDQSGKTLEDLPELSDHFIDLPLSPSTARKAARKSVALLSGDDSDVDLLKSKASDLLKPVGKRLANAAHDVEVSPSKVAEWANDTKKSLLSNKIFPKSLTKSVSTSIHGARSQLSQVSTVAALSAIVEGAHMTKALVPISYEVKLGGLRSITVPDLLVFTSVDEYWKPILTWASFQVVPLLLAMVFNLRADSVPKRSRKAHAAEYTFDPVTFAVSKLLLVYLAFNTSLGSSYPGDQVGIVKYIVGEETFYIGTAITLLYALYEAIL